MTITIHRPVRRPRLAVSLGLAAILVAAALAISENTDTETGAPVASTPVVSSETQQFMLRLQSLQDNYLPPAVMTASAWMRLESLQDGYLPPAASESSNSVRSDDRTSQPR